VVVLAGFTYMVFMVVFHLHCHLAELPKHLVLLLLLLLVLLLLVLLLLLLPSCADGD